MKIKTEFRPGKFLGSWEMILVYILLIINIVLMALKGNVYFMPGTIQAIIQSSLDLSFMVLGMVFILLLGGIDVSVASIMIMSAMTIGLVFKASSNSFLAILCGLA
ncbi:MAG: ABC transporter permease, partial [Treponema sp.]|nr:ABC transporter permease [Treponema sp.]